jgi:hypothetical protein
MFQNFKLRRDLTIISLGAMLAGCGGSPLSAPPASIGAVPQARTHQPTGRSWMSPTASGQDLLYVTDGEDVYAYAYPHGQLVGELTGFVDALGECVDAAGDVFIVTPANKSNSSGIIYEYPHGGTSPIARLSDPNPVYGCAVDSHSGNLAVVGGGVAVYKHASGEPVIYDGSVGFYFCGYDTKGNLYLSAETQDPDQDQLDGLPAGGNQVEQITLSVPLYNEDYSSPPSVQWDGKYMTVSSTAEREPVYLYRLRISGDTAKVVGTTTLSSKRNTLKSGQIWIQGNRALGADFNGKASGGVDSWSYPNAAKPRGIVPHTVSLFPFGIVVSPAVSQ